MTDILPSSQDADGVLRLTMNDGARRNPLSEAMLTALREAFDTAASDPAHCLVTCFSKQPSSFAAAL